MEHVGSTSVPGLDAKPFLDVLLLVPDPADESAYVGSEECERRTAWRSFSSPRTEPIWSMVRMNGRDWITRD